MKSKLLSVLFTLASIGWAICQTNNFKLDDTIQVNNLNAQAREFIIKGEYLKADSLIKEALVLSEKLKFKNGIYNGLTNKGVVFWYQDNYPKSLDSYLKALTLAEQINNKLFISRALTNIGLVYSSKNEFAKALDYYEKALVIKKEIGDKKAEAIILSNIAQIYNDKDDLKNALDYYFMALEKDKLLNNNGGLVALNYVGVGSVYKKQNEIKLASEYFIKSLKIADSLNDKVLLCNVLINIGDLHLIQHNYSEAEKKLIRALNVSVEIGDLNNQKDAYKTLSELYEKINKWDLSLQNYKKFIDIQDSVFNESNTKKMVRLEMNFEFDKKESAVKLEHEKKEAITNTERNKKQIIIWSICGILFLVIIFSIYVYRIYLEKQNANIELTKQKHIIEEKQKEILDSIHYAKRIQTALITPEKYIERSLNRLNKNA